MKPAGYMLKKVLRRPGFLDARNVDDIYSLSAHVSDNFADYIKFWMHNGYWLFDSPAVMRKIADETNLDLSGTTLFYYEVFEQQFDEHSRGWSTFTPEPSFTTNVDVRGDAQLQGYDVATFSVNTTPECSPLSCNGLATQVTVNRHCLIDSFERAKWSLEAGKFDHSEPGPFRIFAVYTLGS